MVEFRKIESIDPIVTYLVSTLSEKLNARQKVLWLVPGGSSIEIAVAVSHKLTDVDTTNLAITLTDERYGPVGHEDSNWHQLEQSGFTLPKAKLFPVLTGKDMDSTISNFASLLQKQLDEADYKLGFFGIGADGHTAGILPGTVAVNSTDFAAGYDAGNFKRITMTGPAIAKLNEAVVYAMGDTKWPVIDQLDQDIDVDKQPAQFLKQVPKLTIYNDSKGESV